MTLNDLLEALVVGKRLLLKSCANWSTNTYFHFAISWFYVSMVPFLAAGAPQAPAALGLRSRRAGQVNGAGLSPTGDWKWTGGPGCRRGWGGPCMCLCTVYGSHRVHVFENQKHFLLYHQSFSQKLENTKKKESVSAVHFEAVMPVIPCKLPPSHPDEARRLSHIWGSCIQEVHVGPPTWRLCQLMYNRSLLHNWLWGPGPSRDPMYRQKQGHTSSSVPSLKT